MVFLKIIARFVGIQDRLVNYPELHIVSTAICTQHLAVNGTVSLSELERLVGDICCHVVRVRNGRPEARFCVQYLNIHTISPGNQHGGTSLEVFHLIRLLLLQILLMKTTMSIIFHLDELCFKTLHHDVTWLRSHIVHVWFEFHLQLVSELFINDVLFHQRRH